MILLQQRHSKGQIYSLKAVWTFYSNRQGQKHQLESGVYRSNKFKDRIQGFIGDAATFVEPPLSAPFNCIVKSWRRSSAVSANGVQLAIAYRRWILWWWAQNWCHRRHRFGCWTVELAVLCDTLSPPWRKLRTYTWLYHQSSKECQRHRTEKLVYFGFPIVYWISGTGKQSSCRIENSCVAKI